MVLLDASAGIITQNNYGKEYSGSLEIQNSVSKGIRAPLF